MINNIIEVENVKLKILKIISEGGFGIVYLVEPELKPTVKMALKKMVIQDQEVLDLAKKELQFLKDYCSKPNDFLINYIGSKIIEDQPNRFVFYILTEFCPNGTLFDLMARYLEKGLKFTEEEILRILNTINNCLVHLHSLGIIHCDFKIENLLFLNWDKIKLCDFGSVNAFSLNFNNIPKSIIHNFENYFEKQTTLMYRPPEMCDLSLNYLIDCKVDMWALGCILFVLMFFKHPFHESSKLSIISASYFYPENSTYSEKLENLLRNLLTPNPQLRPSSWDVKEIIENWNNFDTLELNQDAISIKNDSNALKRNLHTPTHKKEKTKVIELDDSGFNFTGIENIIKEKKSTLNPTSNSNKSNFLKMDFNTLIKNEKNITDPFDVLLNSNNNDKDQNKDNDPFAKLVDYEKSIENTNFKFGLM